jgi:hypothetical protein
MIVVTLKSHHGDKPPNMKKNEPLFTLNYVPTTPQTTKDIIM